MKINGWNTTNFVTAFDKIISYAVSIGTVVSYNNRMDKLTWIDYASIIPGLIEEFEITDVLFDIVSRDFLIVISPEYKYFNDTKDIYKIAIEKYEELVLRKK